MLRRRRRRRAIWRSPVPLKLPVPRREGEEGVTIQQKEAAVVAPVASSRGQRKMKRSLDSMPHLPPHFPPKRRPGVQPPLLDTSMHNPSPSELFRMYFDRAVVKTLCATTNRNAVKNIAAGKKFKWTELTEAELYQFIGLTLYMAILTLPKLSDYWRVNSIFRMTHPHKVMSRDRFLTITWNIHMSDPAEDAFNDGRKGIMTVCTGYAPCMTVYV